MMSNRPARIVSIGGILAALAILLQSAPVFLPGIGLMLSPLATLPIALAAVVSPYMGLITLISSALILFLISPQEAAIFLLSTGILGLTLGTTFNKGILKSLALTGGALFAGINSMTSIVGITVFGDITPDYSLMTTQLIFILFALVYSVIWIFILKFFIHLLLKTKQFNLFIQK